MIHILTLAIGHDYCKALEKGLLSKKTYAEKHGYKYLQGDEKWWDRNRPIAWSKVPFLLNYLNSVPDGELVWLSDADVLITNMDIKLEEHIVPLLTQKKDKNILMIYDSCGHVNSGNMLMINCKWTRDFWSKVYEQEDCIYHIWWENAAIVKLLEDTEINKYVEISKEHKKFNAYIMGLKGEPLWEPNDFLLHFAGIYNHDTIKKLMDDVLGGGVPRMSMDGKTMI